MRPIPMILHCPVCGRQHIDAAEPENDWDNPPHTSHLCHGCGTVWRPADVSTTGVARIETRGSRDTWTPEDNDGFPSDAELIAISERAEHGESIPWEEIPLKPSGFAAEIEEVTRATMTGRQPYAPPPGLSVTIEDSHTMAFDPLEYSQGLARNLLQLTKADDVDGRAFLERAIRGEIVLSPPHQLVSPSGSFPGGKVLDMTLLYSVPQKG